MSPVLDMLAVTGNATYPDASLGYESLTRAARLGLFERLNDEILVEQERWEEADTILQTEGLDDGVGQITLETVDTRDLHEGPHRSILDMPPDRFPNVSAMAYRSSPAAGQFDQADRITFRLYVEVFVKAGPVPEGQELAHETIVQRRIARTTEAAHRALMADPSFMNTVEPLELPPVGGITQQVWLRKEARGAGPRYLIQSSRLEYTLQRQAQF